MNFESKKRVKYYNIVHIASMMYVCWFS